MALLKYLKKKEEGSASLPTLGMLKGSSLTELQLRQYKTELQLRKANKAVLGIAESKEPNKRGKYNQYTPEQLIYDYASLTHSDIAACMHTVTNNFHGGCGQC